MARPFALTLLTALAAAILTVDGAALAGEIEAGGDLALRLCARCHLNEGQGEKLAPGEIPGFRAIASRPGVSRDGIVTWLGSIPDAMPNHHLTRDEMNKLASFILSLRSGP